ncbi:glycosyl hydrolase [Actinomadura macra]|uniref:glycosyl hydrolase n=1 Tax=Actinomadura macra TaxID=46164 RepID=UPI00082A6279|nr:glycosyl hydrolase [Actinomadura macra]
MTTDRTAAGLDRRKFLGGFGALGAALALPAGDALALTSTSAPAPASPSVGLAEAFRDPGPRLRPRFTWWWPGPAVKDAELRAEVREMVEAGFGGAQFFEAPGLAHPPHDRRPPERFQWGTPHWNRRVETALREARHHDFRIDFQVSSGWPWSSPAVSGEHAALAQQQLVFGHQEVAGPSRFNGVPPRPADMDRRDARLVAAVAARLQTKAILDPKHITDLTPFLDGQGRVHWTVPEGRWAVFGFWQVPTGQKSNDSTSPNDPLVLDQLNAEATRAATADLDRRLLDRLGPLAAEVADRFHEDSLEFQFTGLLWTGRFLEEFRARRGYDLTVHLPALAVVSWHSDDFEASRQVYDFAGSAGQRVRHDYNETLTELWIENHVRPARTWAQGHGLDFQGRAHNLSMDIVAVNKAYAAPDADPFDGPIGITRMITSGGRLAGNEIASLEIGDITYGDYMITLEALKYMADKGFVGGANEQVFHGFPYRFANGAGWPSWWPWSSEYDLGGRDYGFGEGFTPALPLWRHLRPFADYLARAQTVLRAGRPVTDIAIYRDIHGYGRVEDPRTDERGDPLLNAALAASGYSFDIVDPGTLAQEETVVRDQRLVVQAPGYSALVVELDASKNQGVVDNSDAMSVSVAQRLVSFARDGLPIVFVGRFPDRGVSHRDPAREDTAVRAAVADLRRSPRVRLVDGEAAVPAALAQLGVRPDLSFDRPQQVYGVHRRTATGDYWFLCNTSGALDESIRLVGGTTARFTASFAVGDRAPDLWDLWTGEIRGLGCFRVADGRVAVPVELAPGETVVIGFERPIGSHVELTTAEAVIVRGDGLRLRSTRAGAASARLADGRTAMVDFGRLPTPLEPAGWTLRVEGAVPSGKDRHELRLGRLADWRAIPRLRETSGTGTYRTTVRLDGSWTGEGRGAYLELGRVEGGVQVRVNGRRVHPASVAPPRIDVGPFLRPGRNTIEVEVTTTLRNRLTALAEQGKPGYSRFLKRPVKTQPYGLIGPVRLVPYAERGVEA